MAGQAKSLGELGALPYPAACSRTHLRSPWAPPHGVLHATVTRSATDAPYWSTLNLAPNGVPVNWAFDPATRGSEPAACGFLDVPSATLRRAPCSRPLAFLCMAPSECRPTPQPTNCLAGTCMHLVCALAVVAELARQALRPSHEVARLACHAASAAAPQHVAPAELSGDGLPDVVVAGNCPWDNGGSLMVLQQPSPSSLVLTSKSLITPSLSARTCGDGIPYWGREECDTGEDNGAWGCAKEQQSVPCSATVSFDALLFV